MRVLPSSLVAHFVIGLASLALPSIAHARVQPPTSLVATTLSASRIDLSWTDNSRNEGGFLIERAPASGNAPGTWAQIATVGANVTTFSDTGVSANRTYWYRVRAKSNGNGANSAYSNQASATTPPLPPSNLTAAAASVSQIDLSWTGDSNGESGFLIEQAPDSGGTPGAWVQIATVGANVTTNSDMGLAPNTTYWYRVRAYNSAGNSGFSNVVGARTRSIVCTLSVVGWGYDGYGETIPPPGLTNVVRIAAGNSYSLALKGDGTVVGWGNNDSGKATPPTNLTGIVSIAAGDSHSLGLKNGGTVVGWGADWAGQASPPADLTNALAVAAGLYHSLALKSDGTVVGWGYNGYGETTPSANVTNVVAIAASAYDSLALKSDGTVVGWGANWYGETTPPADLTNAVAIAAGLYHSLALKSDGTVVGWGNDSSGQATPPTNLTGVVAIAAGAYDSLALKSDGTIVGWGDDGSGQVSGADGVTGVTAIAAGAWHNIALATVPATPSPLVAHAVATNQVSLSWADRSGSESAFKIERAPDNNFTPGTWAQIATVGVNVTNYSDTTVETNTTYWYRVRASGSVCGDSPYSRTVVSLVPPAAPYSLSAVGVATNQVEVDLYWYAGSGNEAGYRIERAPDDNGNPGTWAEIATVVGGTNTFYIDAAVSPDTPYWYRVRAYNLFGDSPYSDPTVVSVEPPGAPYLYASVVTTNQAEVDLQWYDSSGIAAGYKLERAPDVNGSPGTWTEITNTVNNLYSDTGLMANATYWYRVRAYNLIGDSEYSDPISANCLPPSYAPYPYAYFVATNQVEVNVYWYDYYNNYLTVAGYKIERAPDMSGNPGVWTEIAAVTNGYSYYNAYTETGVAQTNATYWYRVRAYNVAGESPYSYPTSVSIGPPSYAPSYINAYTDPTNVEVDVYWYDSYNYSGSVSGYKLERAPDVSGSPGTWVEIANVAGGFSNYSFYRDTGVMANATYWYRVRAYNVVGDSPYSYVISISVVPPAAPYFIYAYTVPTSLEADVYWYESDSNLAGYKIERAPDVNGNPGTWAQIATNVGGYNNSYQDTTVEPNKTYWYRARAYNGIGDSAPSAAVSVSLIPPAAPSTLTATIAATNQVKLSWSESDSNVAGYKVERAPDDNGAPGAWSEIATNVGSYSTYYSDATVEINQTYWYRVRAYNADGDSPYSNEASVTIAAPAAPSNLSATLVSSSRIDLTWTDNSNNESSFKIERSTDGTNFTQIAQVLPNTTNYLNTGLVPNSTYYYRVRASNPVGDSEFSNVASAGTLAQCPASVVGWGYNGYGQTTPTTNLTGVTAITAGNYHSLALKTNGTVVGWGYNGYGQTTPPTNLTGVAAITAGSYHSLALKTNGTVVGWGYNYYGQATPPTNLTAVVAIDAGYYHSLALKSDGTVVGWGYYYYATPPTNLTGVVAIAAGGSQSLALTSDGTVVGWGDYYPATPPAGLTGVVGIAAGDHHSLALKSDGTVVGWGYNYYGETTPPAGLSNVVAIAAGTYHSLALKSDGTVVGWGYNYYGQATTPAGLTGVVAIAAGGYHSVALSTGLNTPSALTATAISASEVSLSWIENVGNEDGFKIERAPDNGGSPGMWTQIVAVAAGITNYADTGLAVNTTYWYRVRAYNVCGDSDYSSQASATPVQPPSAPSSLAATAAPSSQINLSWTDNSGNEDGFKIERSTDGTNFTQIAQLLPNTTSYRNYGLWPGTNYYYRVRAYKSGVHSNYSNLANASTPTLCPTTIVGWGDNDNGQSTAPTELAGVVAIAGGFDHSLTLKSDGTVVGWGGNSDGQATPPAGLTGVVAIAAGWDHSLALKGDGTVVGWGVNWAGQATAPAGLAGVVAIAAGGNSSLALKSDGTVVGWGYNYYGQTNVPAGLTGVVAIAAGLNHSLALRSDGTVVGWGDNYYGQSTPPAGLTGVVAITGGWIHSLALKSDGTVLGWGQNYYGAITPPAALTGVVAVAAGGWHSLALKSDGTVVVWGANYDWNGNFQGQATPPAELTGVVAIAAGMWHSLALTPSLRAPSAPTAAVISGNEVGLSWTYTASNEDGFKIERAPDSGGSPGTWTQIVAVAASITNYTDAGLTTNTTYWYRLLAYNACTNSLYSSQVSVTIAPPPTPSNLTAMVADTNQVNLSWKNNYPDVGGFKIERALDNGGSPGTWTQIAVVGANVTSYGDGGPIPNTAYWYRVRAYNALGDSPYSSLANATLSGGQLVTVMQWNVEGNDRPNNFNYAIANILNYNRPDILLFNEIYAQGLSASQNQAALIDWVTNNVPYLGSQPGVTFYVDASPQSDGFIRNATISRFPILNATTYNDGLRGLHAFQVQINGTPALQVYHAHLKCCSDGDSCGRKQSEAQNDAVIISGAASNSLLPYIFAGDWNEDENNPECTFSSTYHPITTIREVGGLVEFKPTTLDGEYRTWSTAPTTPSIRFDYILAATNRLAPVSGYVFSSMVWANHGLYAGNYNDSQVASDHYCVFAKYFFPAPDFIVTPTNALASAGYIGGPFSPGQQVYTLTNTNSIPLPWGVTATASWLSISATNGTLAAGASTNITVSTGSAANTLAASQYAATIGFNNTATHAFATRNAGLTVLWPPPVAAFSGSPTVGPVPLGVTFMDTSTGNITGRFWDFGDGSTTNIITNSVVHVYAAGIYTVMQIETGPGGVSTNIQPNYITALTPYQAWQIQYFGSTNNPNAAPDADADGTGQNNLFKFAAGLDPTNAASVFRITSVAQEGCNIRATWSCAAGHNYVLQSTTSTTGGGYSDPFVDISPVIVASGAGESTTNFLVIGVLAASGDTPAGTNTNAHSSLSTASAIEISALYSRGLAESSGVVPTNSLLMLGTFSISESAIRSSLTTGGVSDVMSAFTPYGAPFAVGDGIGIPSSWDVVVNAMGFSGQQIYLVAFDQPTVAASTQMGIFTAPSWVFPGDGSPLVIDLEDVTDFVIGARGGLLTIDSVGYTFDDTAQLAFIPVPSRYYRVRLAP